MKIHEFNLTPYPRKLWVIKKWTEKEINKALRQILADLEETERIFKEPFEDSDIIKEKILKSLANRFKEIADDIFCTIKF